MKSKVELLSSHQSICNLIDKLEEFKCVNDVDSSRYVGEFISRKLTIQLALSGFIKDSMDLGYYWNLCSLKSYKTSFSSRMKAFLEEMQDAREIDFVELELKRRGEYVTENWVMLVSPTGVRIDLSSLISSSDLSAIRYSNRSIIEFLTEKERLFYNPQNPYPEVFVDRYAFDLFIYLMKKIGTKKDDLCCLYRIMSGVGEGLMKSSNKSFIEFCEKEIGIRLTKVTNREKYYLSRQYYSLKGEYEKRKN